MSEHLHHKLSVLHQNLLHGKLPRAVHWSDALELIGHLGRAEPRGTEEWTFVVGAHREIFKRPHTPELGIDEVSRLRKFLVSAGSKTSQAASAPLSRMVLVIDHHAAHVFTSSEATPRTNAVTITPYDPHHFHRHLIHRKEAHYQGDRVPEETSFYKEVAGALAPATEVVLIGHGTGKSSAVAVLAAFLEKHHPDVFLKVKATETADLSSLTDAQAEALARQHLAMESAPA